MKLCASLSASSNVSQLVMRAQCIDLAFGVDHTGSAVSNRFFVYRQAFQTQEWCTKSLVVVGLVHYEADDVVFPPLLVKWMG